MDFIDNKAVIAPSGSRIGLIEYSSTSQAHLVFGLGDRLYALEVKHSVDVVNYGGGWYCHWSLRGLTGRSCTDMMFLKQNSFLPAVNSNSTTLTSVNDVKGPELGN